MAERFPEKCNEHFFYRFLNDTVFIFFFLCDRHNLNIEQLVKFIMDGLYSEDDVLDEGWIKEVSRYASALKDFEKYIVYLLELFLKKNTSDDKQDIVLDFCILLSVHEYYKRNGAFQDITLFKPCSWGVEFKGCLKQTYNKYWMAYKLMFSSFASKEKIKKGVVVDYCAYLVAYDTEILTPLEYKVVFILNRYIELV